MQNLTEQELAILSIIDRMRKIQINHVCEPLTGPEGRLLFTVSEQAEGITVSALAEKLEMPMAAVSRMMRGLEQRGLIERRILPQDRRSILVTITPEGEKVFNTYSERFHGFFQELLEGMDEEQFQKMLVQWNEFVDRIDLLVAKYHV